VRLTADEAYRVRTAMLCLLLHKTPEELAQCDAQGLLDILEIDALIKEREAAAMKRKT